MVVLVVIAFIIVAGYLERRRVTAMAEWQQAHGFTAIDPFVPTEYKTIAAIASLATGADGNSLRWGSVVTGASSGTRVTFAELSYSPTAGQTSRWFTIAAWPEAHGEPLRLRGGRLVSADGHAGWITEGLLTPGRADALMGQIVEARRAMAGR
jgi:hypothetical protein